MFHEPSQHDSSSLAVADCVAAQCNRQFVYLTATPHMHCMTNQDAVCLVTLNHRSLQKHVDVVIIEWLEMLAIYQV